MSSQAFLRSMFASEEESESESLHESESLDELSFFFFFFFDTFFCFLGFFRLFLFILIAVGIITIFLFGFLLRLFLFNIITVGIITFFLFGFLLRFFLLFSLTVGIVVTVSATSFLFLLLFTLAVRVVRFLALLRFLLFTFLFFTFLGLTITLLLLLFLFLFVKAGQQLHRVLGGLVQLLKALLDLVLHPLPLFIELFRNLGRLLLDCHIVGETLAQRRLFARGGTLRPARLGSRPEGFQRLQSQPFHLIHGFLFAGLPPFFLFLRILGLGASPLFHLSNLLLQLF